MCGIVGYVGSRPAFPLLKAGLRHVEYRGYDSAGMALLAGPRLAVLRVVGGVGNLATDDPRLLASTAGIAHTRWATHGRPTVSNAHPHSDCHGALAVVHNGIISNHAALREWLTSSGHRFTSDTDTEVIAHALEEFSGGSLEAAVQKVMDVLQGDYAFAVLSDRASHCLVAARSGHPPLLVGIGTGECFLASDVLALVPETCSILALEEGEIAVVTPQGVEITRGGEPMSRAPLEIPWTPEEAERGGHPHFMHKEIHEQPSATRRTLAAAAPPAAAIAARRWRTVKRVTFVACGTSYHAGLVGRWFFERLARVPVTVDISSEFLFREPLLGRDDLCVVISQSGETADTLAALRQARIQGAATLAICNVPGASMTREADAVMMTATGPEIGVASTKAFTAQIVTLLRLALEAGSARAVVGADARAALWREMSALPAMMESVLRDEEAVASLAALLEDYRDFFFLGRGVGYPLALEGALKLKEIAYVRAEAFPAGEMKHGPLALVDERTVSVVLAPAGPTHDKMVATIEELRARGGHVVALCTAGDGVVPPMVDAALMLPASGDYVAPALMALPLQLFAYHMAVRRGCDVDRPRNLAKSVTVE